MLTFALILLAIAILGSVGRRQRDQRQRQQAMRDLGDPLFPDIALAIGAQNRARPCYPSQCHGD
jgi:hypothetical protein